MTECKIVYCDELWKGIIIGFKDNLIIVGNKKQNEKEESYGAANNVTFDKNIFDN